MQRKDTWTKPAVPLDLYQCPMCASRLDFGASTQAITCRNPICSSHPQGFAIIRGCPLLIDFSRSVIDRNDLMRSDGASDVRRHRRPGGDRRLHMRLYDAAFGTNEAARHVAGRFQEKLRELPHRPRMLVIGGGTIGTGMEALYLDPAIDIFAFDVYHSPNIQFLADAHAIPFVDNSFDAIWIQAVLEHVLDPVQVVAEIHRLLRSGGLVFADTPFMQQVHEGPYDFARFTASGHRWLFRRFIEIEAGVVGGPGTALSWAIRYFFAGVFRSYWVGRLAGAAFIWLRHVDALIPSAWASDGACGVWFFGARAEIEMSPRQALTYYRGAQRKGRPLASEGQCEPNMLISTDN